MATDEKSRPAERDEDALARDAQARHRDEIAEERDRSAEEREVGLEPADNAATRTDRHAAASDRTAARIDREHAARDRDWAAVDRETIHASARARFPGQVSSGPLARAFLDDFLTRQTDLPRDLVEQADLLLTELVTNAAVHADGEITLLVRLSEARLRVEVHDSTPQMPTARPVSSVDPWSASGRGLGLVAALATAWGAHRVVGGGKVVWFELA